MATGVANLLYLNDGDGTFTEIAASAGVDTSTGTSWGVALGDYDGDGLLDIFVTADADTNRLFRNNGNNTFTDTTVAAGVSDTSSSRSAAFADYDGDGDLDLYVAVDGSGGGANLLYQNNGDGTLTERAVAAGVDGGALISKATSWLDIDGDGDFDLISGNSDATDNKIFRNDGGGTFSDVSTVSGVGTGDNTRGMNLGDYNCDGRVDIFLANVNDRNELFENLGNGRFSDVAFSLGLNLSSTSRSPLMFDYDNDGDLDIFVGIGAGSVFYENSASPLAGTYFTISLLGTGGSRDQKGIRVDLLNGAQRVATQSTGSSNADYSSGGDTPVYFYNLDPAVSYSARVTYSDGSSTTYSLGTPNGPTVTTIQRGTGVL